MTMVNIEISAQSSYRGAFVENNVYNGKHKKSVHLEGTDFRAVAKKQHGGIFILHVVH